MGCAVMSANEMPSSEELNEWSNNGKSGSRQITLGFPHEGHPVYVGIYNRIRNHLAPRNYGNGPYKRLLEICYESSLNPEAAQKEWQKMITCGLYSGVLIPENVFGPERKEAEFIISLLGWSTAQNSMK